MNLLWRTKRIRILSSKTILDQRMNQICEWFVFTFSSSSFLYFASYLDTLSIFSWIGSSSSSTTDVSAKPETYLRPEWFLNPSSQANFRRTINEYRWRESTLLDSLSDPKVEELPYGIKAITINETTAECSMGWLNGPNTLYERWWYNDLFAALFLKGSTPSKCLIGSPGTSKSVFQYWLLYRVLRAMHHGKQ